jgi:hypothetical protein
MMEVKQTAHGKAKGVTLNVIVEMEAMIVIMMGAGETVMEEEVVDETEAVMEEVTAEARAVVERAVVERAVVERAGAVVEGMGVAAEVAEVAGAAEGVAVAMGFHIRDHPI